MKKIFKIIASFIPLYLCSCAVNNSYVNSNNKIVVSVEESPLYAVNSKNPQEINKGDGARFKIAFNEDYGYKNSSDGFFEDGFLVVENVQYSETVHIDCAQMVTVFLETYDDCHYSVISDNPVIVEKGSDAHFELAFDDGYVFEQSGDGVFENGKFVVKNVESSRSVSLLTKIRGSIHIHLVCDNLRGSATINDIHTTDDYGNYNDIISIKADPLEGKQFVCWSADGYISSQMPYSFERELSFYLKDDVTLYANFWDGDENTIIYHGNGGATMSGDESIYYPHTKANHIRINTIQGSKAFYKSGYQLESWNTMPNGSGDRIGLGSRIKIENENVPLHLYAKWIEETDINSFMFLQNEDLTYSVAGCTSEEDVIVIPETYNGEPVTKITANSFTGLSFKSLYFPQYLKEVESNSVINCENFKSLHFFDYLDIIPNNFYVGKKPSSLYINANTDPRYIGSYQNAFVRKTDLLTECDDEKYVFIGNSNTLYSIDGSMISNYFGKDVLCYGVQYGVGVAWELACLRHLCREVHNTVVFCCEFGAATIGSFSEEKFYAAEGNYDLLLAIDFSELNFSNVYGAYSQFKEYKNDAPVTPYSKNDWGCDRYGCSKLNIEPYRDEDWAASVISTNLNYYINGGFDWVENYCAGFTNSTFLISCCSFNRNCIPEEKREELYSSYQQSIIDYTSFSVISSLSDYAFSGSAFHNDNYHLIYSYAVERTNKFIVDLDSRPATQ